MANSCFSLIWTSVHWPELYRLSNAHFDRFARKRLDVPRVESLASSDGFPLSASCPKRFECNDDVIIHFAVEAILIEEGAPQRQGRRMAIG